MLYNKHQNIINYAIKLAKKSFMLHKHAAVLVNRNNIIGEGYNKAYKYLSKSYSIHAEHACILDAIKKHKNKLQLLNLDLYVIRICIINNTTYLRKSTPCDNCKKIISNYIKKYNIKKIYYSIDDEYVKNLI